MTNTRISPDRIAGAIFGSAFGDAIGYVTEFTPYNQIVAAGGAKVPTKLRVSDDTQMALAVARSLNYWDRRSLASLRQELYVDFIEWSKDPDNNRAPGVTCMSAIRALDRLNVGEWVHGTGADSSGCGSVMRAAWIGLYSSLTDEQVEHVAMMQAVLTHAPAENAYCSAALASLTRALARDEVQLGGCSEWLLGWEMGQRGKAYPREALGSVNEVVRERRATVPLRMSRDEYVAVGLDHVEWVGLTAAKLRGALSVSFWDMDPCDVAGQGWRAREAVALAVGIADAMGDDIIEADGLLRAAQTNGDSDSIGCILGSLIGAARGNAWPSEWLHQLEPRYRSELVGVVGHLTS